MGCLCILYVRLSPLYEATHILTRLGCPAGGSICLLGLITLGLALPETRGFTLEDMEYVFDRPILSGWRTFRPDSKGHWAENHSQTTDGEAKREEKKWMDD
jgi:hypothetical protein